MKRIKFILCAIVVLFLAAVYAPRIASAEAMPVYEAGQNNKLTWAVKDNVLTISGKDAMTEFCVNGDSATAGYMIETSAPWTKYRDSVKTIVIEDGVTSVGWFAFYKFKNVTKVYIGKNVTQIDGNAFGECTSLKNVYLAASKSESGYSLHIDPDNDYFDNADWTWGTYYQYTYKVKFSANGGTGSMSTKTYTSDKSYTLPTCAYSRSGYVLYSWNTKKDGSGKDYANKATVKNLTTVKGATVTLYAQWMKKGSYKITYYLNGGKNSASNPKHATGTKDVTLKSATRTGYTFLGWYKDSKFKTKITVIKKGNTKNLSLYAKWSANKYYIVFKANGGSGSMSKKTCTYGKSYKLTANAYTRKGYSFNGWNTKSDGSGRAYNNKASIKNLTSVKGKTITLYAQWIDRDQSELIEAKEILRLTCAPAYQWWNNNKVTLRRDASGRIVWSCGTTANGVLKTIQVYNNQYSISASTCCDQWGDVNLTVSGDQSGLTNASLKDGTYDFKTDPNKVLIGWSMFKDTTTKAQFNAMANQKVSDTVYQEVLKKYNSYTSGLYGGSCVIIYGKSSDGTLVGKYAGSVYYSRSSTSAEYYLVGINPSGSDYGKTVTGTLKY